MKHTPTPWFAKREGFSTVYVEARIGGGMIQEVAACGPTADGSEQQEANAELIVRAVNSHAALVSALEGLLNAAEDVDGFYFACSESIANAKTVLALVKGE